MNGPTRKDRAPTDLVSFIQSKRARQNSSRAPFLLIQNLDQKVDANRIWATGTRPLSD